MARPKEEFQRDQDTVVALRGVLASPNFLKLWNAARSEFSTKNPTSEQGRGLTVFESVLFNMVEPDDNVTTWEQVTTGERLDHALEIPIRHGDQPKPKEGEEKK